MPAQLSGSSSFSDRFQAVGLPVRLFLEIGRLRG